jgi:hypothetical protein
VYDLLTQNRATCYFLAVYELYWIAVPPPARFDVPGGRGFRVPCWSSC